jgi:hypothetical protein
MADSAMPDSAAPRDSPRAWMSRAETAVVVVGVVRLARRDRWRAAGTVLAAWAGAGIGTRRTGNDVARSLGLPLSPEEAVDLIADTEPAPMDLGVTDDATFAHAATVRCDGRLRPAGA